MSLDVELKEIRQINATITLTQATEKSLKRDKEEQLSALRERIQAGETTGDRLLDICIVCYGDVDGKKRPLLEAIETTISPFPNQMVLIVSRFTELAGCTGFGGSGYKAEVCVYHLGLMTDTPHLFAATDKHWRPLSTPSVIVERSVLAKPDRGRPFKWVSSDNAVAPRYESGIWPALIPEGLNDFDLQTRQFRSEKGYRNRDDFPVELVVGDSAVEAWFELLETSQELISGRNVLGYDKAAPMLF